MTTHEPTRFERRASEWLARCMDGARRRAVPVLLATLALTVAAGWLAATQLGINSNVKGLVSDELPHRKAEIEFESIFPARFYDLAVVIRAPTPEDAEAFAAALASRLAPREDVIEFISGPFLEPYFVNNGLLFQTESELSETLERLTLSAPLLAELNRTPGLGVMFDALADADRLERLDVDDTALDAVYGELAAVTAGWLEGRTRNLSWQRILGDTTGDEDFAQRTLTIRPIQDFSALQPAEAALSAIEFAIEDALSDAAPGTEAGITGDPALRREELGSVIDGMGWSLALSAVSVLVLLLVAFRSSALVVAALMVLVVNLVLTAGFAALTVGELNLISVAFAVLMIGLGADFVIHVTLHIQFERRHGSSLSDAIQHTAGEIGPALVLAALTTSAAFLSFMPTDFTGIAQLGLIAGGGVIFAMLGAVILLPATFGLLGDRIAGAGKDLPPGADRFRKPAVIRPLALATIIAAVLSLPLLSGVRFDADPMNLRDPESQSVRTFMRLFDEPGVAPYGLDLLAPSLDAADERASELEALPEVESAITLTSLVPENQAEKAMLIEFAADSLFFSLNDEDRQPVSEDPVVLAASLDALIQALADRESVMAGRLAELLPAVAERLSQGDDLSALRSSTFAHFDPQLAKLRAMLIPEPVGIEDVPDHFRESFVAPGGEARIEIIPAEDTRGALAKETFVEAVRAIAPDVTGAAAGFIATGKVVSRSILEATLLAAAGGALLLWLFARSAPLVLLILLPLALAGILTSAAGATLGIPYNFANIIVIPLLIGLGVDSGIHLALRARHAPGEFTVYRTTTPRAVFFSALTTIVSFGSLIASSHRGTSSMGALLTLGVGFTLLCTVVVLPVLLHAAWSDKVEARY